jgi:hypothetical protein
MPKGYKIDYRKSRCSGFIEEPSGDANQFTCYPDGRAAFDRPETLPARLKDDLGRHCWNNCRSRRWIRPRSLSGCGCSRRAGR